MNGLKARSFITIMVFIAFLALILRVLIGQVIKGSVVANESTATANLKLISAALESYAKDKQGAYPDNFALLMKATPPYVDKDYIDSPPIKGYYYNCPRLEASGYSCYATPLKCQITGNMTYSVGTGGLFISENCSRKD